MAARDLLITVVLNVAEHRCTQYCPKVVQVFTVTLLVSSFLCCYHLFRRWEEMWGEKKSIGNILLQ